MITCSHDYLFSFAKMLLQEWQDFVEYDLYSLQLVLKLIVRHAEEHRKLLLLRSGTCINFINVHNLRRHKKGKRREDSPIKTIMVGANNAHRPGSQFPLGKQRNKFISQLSVVTEKCRKVP